MNILFFVSALALIIAFLYLGFSNRNVPFVVGGGILCILFGASIFLLGMNVTVEKCESLVNQTVLDGNNTNYSYDVHCVQETLMDANTTEEKAIWSSFALLFIVLGAGFVLGKFVNE